ncbi:uncharacterized protein [Argopecten irradians]|uniref:uncharacterized protein n=1 Tax=Argopecten irradians TaxID=31199 RepID=UPI00371B05D0
MSKSLFFKRFCVQLIRKCQFEKFSTVHYRQLHVSYVVNAKKSDVNPYHHGLDTESQDTRIEGHNNKLKKKQVSLRELWSSEESFPSVHELGKKKKRKREKRTENVDIQTENQSDHNDNEMTIHSKAKSKISDTARGGDRFSHGEDLRSDKFANRSEFPGLGTSGFSRLSLLEKEDDLWTDLDSTEHWRQRNRIYTEDYPRPDVHMSLSRRSDRNKEWLQQLDKFNRNFNNNNKKTKK